MGSKRAGLLTYGADLTIYFNTHNGRMHWAPRLLRLSGGLIRRLLI
jgi:hypothetical protein